MTEQASAVPFDEAPVTTRYWLSIIIFAITGVVDFFDFFVVGFLVSVLAPTWHLTFGQTDHADEPVSARCWARSWRIRRSFRAQAAGDIGRPGLRPDLGAIAFIPKTVGLCLRSCASSSASALPRERRRRFLRSSNSPDPSSHAGHEPRGGPGRLRRAVGVGHRGFLLPLVGWRGLAAVGFLPIILGIDHDHHAGITALAHQQGPCAQAQASIRKLYQVGGESFVLPALSANPATFADLFAEQRASG